VRCLIKGRAAAVAVQLSAIFALECARHFFGDINGPSKKAKSEEAKQAAALDDDRLEAIENFGGPAQGIRDSASAASHGARRPLESAHRRDLPRDDLAKSGIASLPIPPTSIAQASAMRFVMRRVSRYGALIGAIPVTLLVTC
jgi:hypothetical protein